MIEIYSLRAYVRNGSEARQASNSLRRKRPFVESEIIEKGTAKPSRREPLQGALPPIVAPVEARNFQINGGLSNHLGPVPDAPTRDRRRRQRWKPFNPKTSI